MKIKVEPMQDTRSIGIETRMVYIGSKVSGTTLAGTTHQRPHTCKAYS